MDIGQQIIESVVSVLKPEAKPQNEAAGEVLVNGKPIKMEEYGTPVAEGDTIKIPVVIATVYEDYGAPEGKAVKPDQAFLDKNRDAIMQRLVVRLNRSRNEGYGFNEAPTIYFDSGNFKLEFLEGNVVRLRTTIILDLRSSLRNVRDVRWRMSDAIYDLIPRENSGLKVAR